LSGNPFCESLSGEEYRQTVIKILPQIQKLDNKGERIFQSFVIS